MKSHRAGCQQSGFTLIEILVVLILLAILAAAVFPLVTQQTGTADPVRVANDLATIKTGAQSFRLDLRPRFPGDLEDLGFKPSTTEHSVEGTPYNTTTLADRWNGPYIDAALAESQNTTKFSGSAFATGYSAQIQNPLVCYNRAANTVETSCSKEAHAVAVEITGLDATMFNAIDVVIDGAAVSSSGNFRMPSSSAYYFLAPFH